MSESPDNRKPVVFISYSHEDEAWKDLMLPHFKHLERLGVLEVWNDRDIGHGADWYAVIREKLEQTRFAVCLVSANFLASRFCMEEEIPYLLQKRAEQGVTVLPVLVGACLWKAERWLDRTQMLPRDAKDLKASYSDNPDPVFTEIAETIYDALQPGYVAPPPPQPTGEPPEKVDISRLPETGDLLFGRRTEMTLLDDAWKNDNTNVVVLKAAGGVGKSTLMRVWTKSLEQDNYRGAKRVFAWSFYSQGTNQRVTSADVFIAEALTWFGDPDPTAGSPWDKGERLARLVAEQPTLLLLDGMEPLQSHVKEENGALKDPGLQMLVRDLARENSGLCVISTRETVGDLVNSRFAGAVIHEDLERVSLTAGRALMRVRGVTGDDDALESAVDQFDRHALAINLLASYLMEFENGDIAAVTEVARLQADPSDTPRSLASSATEDIPPAWHVIAAFERRLRDTPELDLLRLLGLFDRPITDGEFQALTADPPIPGLTDKLLAATGSGTGEVLPAGSSQNARSFLDQLRKLGLVAAESHHEPNETDAHPLIREYFGERMKDEGGRMKAMDDSSFILPPSSFREAHRRLYEHLKQSAPELPDNLNDMMPLYHAVAHGCKAGLQCRAFEEVFWSILLRDEDHGKYSIDKLSALGQVLTATAAFFARPWDKLQSGFSPIQQFRLLLTSGHCLRVIGRPQSSIDVLSSALELARQAGDFANAARAAARISQAYATEGEIGLAMQFGERAVEFADREQRSDKAKRERRDKRTSLGAALRFAGRVSDARSAFEDASSILKEPLDGRRGFKYWELLLNSAPCEFREVGKLTEQIIKNGKFGGANRKLSEALPKLALGCTLIGSESEQANAMTLMDNAITLIRASRYQDYLCRGLLYRAALWRVRFEISKAERDLSEAETIAERGSMIIFQIEAALERTRLFLTLASVNSASLRFNQNGEETAETQGTPSDGINQAREKLDEAQRLVKQTEKPYEPHVPDWDDWEPPEYVGVFKAGDIVGYHCRNEEIEQLDREIKALSALPE